MRYWLFLYSFFPSLLLSQKPVIDVDACDRWPAVKDDACISDNGKYVAYSIRNQPFPYSSLVVQATNDKWRIELPRANILPNMCFGKKSLKMVFSIGKDSVGILTLGTFNIKYVSNVIGYKVAGNGKWLCCQMKDAEGKLYLYSLVSRRKLFYKGVKNYSLNEQGSVFVTWGDSLVKISDMRYGTERLLWSKGVARDFVFDKKGKQLAFRCSYPDQRESIVYCMPGKGLPREIYSNNISLNLLRFSEDGASLFFVSKQELVDPIRDSNDNAVDITVWHYKDEPLQSQQLIERDRVGYRTSVIDVKSNQNKLLIDFDEDVMCESGDSIWLVSRGYREGRGFSIVSLTGCVHRNLLVDLRNGAHYCFSPDGAYLLFFELSMRKWISYQLLSGKSFVVAHFSESVEMPVIRGWVNDEVILKDFYGDFWRASFHKASKLICLTNGYARKSQVKLELRENVSQWKFKKSVLLYGMKNSDKQWEYYILKAPFSEGALEFLSATAGFVDFMPLRARKKDIYILKRMSSRTSPYYFATSDFRKFSALGQLKPELNYNWFTAELISYRMTDSVMHGILYKPENFDSRKKYPVILYFYESLSGTLCNYMPPQLTDGALNIPWFVSRGYLVCKVDIDYVIGIPGESALRSVQAAADFLCTLPYVDNRCMGLQGHSFGGYEVNFIVTHSNRFAAAVSGAGMSNLVASYNSIFDYSGASRHLFYEKGQGRMGGALWDLPEFYVNNSPFFSAQDMNTPLLLLYNSGDKIVPLRQGRDFFGALKRLGKIVWLLQYDGEGHVLLGKEAKKDFTMRVEHFFDHYLKGRMPEDWLVKVQ